MAKFKRFNILQSQLYYKRCTFANKSDRNTTLKTNDKYEKNQTTNIDPIVFDGT